MSALAGTVTRTISKLYNLVTSTTGVTKMQFDHTYTLAKRTPTKALTEAWQMCENCTHRCTHGKRPMTIREAGALAELHGLKLLDVLAI